MCEVVAWHGRHGQTGGVWCVCAGGQVGVLRTHMRPWLMGVWVVVLWAVVVCRPIRCEQAKLDSL